MVKKFRYGFQDSCPPPSHSRLTSPQILGSSRSLLWAVSLAKNNNQLFFCFATRCVRFDIPPYCCAARVFAGDCIHPKYSITSAPDCQYFFENALGELVGLSMICYTEAQKIIESSFGRIPVKRAHGKVIVFAKMNRKLRLKVAAGYHRYSGAASPEPVCRCFSCAAEHSCLTRQES